MTSEAYLDSIEDTVAEWVDELYWEGRGSSALANAVLAQAEADGVQLTDPENMDEACHNFWNCTEKGLS